MGTCLRWKVMALVVVALSCLLIGCGSSDPTTTTAGPEVSDATTTTGSAGGVGETQGEAIELSLASGHPPAANMAKSVDRWIAKIEEDSGGLLTIRHFSGGTLLPLPEVAAGVQAGTADLGSASMLKELKGQEVVFAMPVFVDMTSVESCFKVFDDVTREFEDMWSEQWKDYKLIYCTPQLPNLIYTLDKPIRKLEDMKGVQIRVAEAVQADLITALGGTPVALPTADAVTALEKGTVDGACWSLNAIADFKLGEKFKYCTQYPVVVGLNYLAMNLDVWNGLSPDLQKVIEDSRDWGLADVRAVLADLEVEAKEYAESSGVEFIELSADERARWDEAVQPVREATAAKLDTLGYPGTDVLGYSSDRKHFYLDEQ